MKYWITYCILLIVSALLISLGLFAGPTDISVIEILGGLFESDEQSISRIVAWEIRLPRIATAVVTGSSLGLAGVLIQLSTRSSFGDPNLFGVGGGATIFLATTAAGIVTLNEFGTFIGCLLSSLVVALILSRLISNKNLSPVKLAIMGIAIGALTISIGTSVISHGRVFPTQVIALLAGSFSGNNWEMVFYVVTAFFICFYISWRMASRFYPIMLGDTLARSLGVNPIRTRTVAMSITGILAGASVYSGGLIGFVGLIAPHITRRLFGNNPQGLILASSLIGAILALGADQIARLSFAPTELPVGMTTTILGAPVMIYLASRMK
ncbi:iron ABC transporter permease [SAR202 cluster bacterium AD-802-E10_MRT_200m]|nr:iron ABC transporter permease [SAR202 cluster bacterium AD-802-E10_MRT_200m]